MKRMTVLLIPLLLLIGLGVVVIAQVPSKRAATPDERHHQPKV